MNIKVHFATYSQTMWKLLSVCCFLVYFSNGVQIFSASFSKIFPVGRFTANCSFDLSFSDDALIDHKLTCSGRTRRNSPEFEVTYSSKSMHIITLKLRFQSRKLTVLSSKVKKSMIKSHYIHLNSIIIIMKHCLAPCQIGYSSVCNSDVSSGAKTAICPASKLV